MGDTAPLITSWSLALHDKADSTRRLYAEVLRDFARHLDGRPVLEAKRRDLQGYFAEMRDRGLAQATIRSRWIALRSFYEEPRRFLAHGHRRSFARWAHRRSRIVGVEVPAYVNFYEA